MRKTLIILLTICLALALAFGLVACNGGDDTPSSPDTSTGTGTGETKLLEFTGITFSDLTVNFDGEEHEILAKNVPDGAEVEYKNNKATLDGVYNATATVSKEGYKTKTYSAKLTIVLTAENVIDAKDATLGASQQNYDFKVNFSGNVNVAGFSGTANANYDGKYRYDSETEALSFYRETSGILLYDSKEYIYNSVGGNKIKIVANEDGEAKRISVVPAEGDLNLVNIPFVEMLKHTQANNLSEIMKVATGKYGYKANIALASDNKYVAKILSFIAGMGASLDMKDVSVSNPAHGIDFFFNLSADRTELLDYTFSASVGFPVKGVDIVLTMTYEQKANNSKIKIPSINGFITDKTAIEKELATINAAVNTVKNADAYSLNVEAKNDFDPGWNVTATVDKYIATLYKNTNDGRVDFNHSYEYKAHHEEDGKENYKYTLANIQDGSTYLVSRKGTNVITAANATVDGQFDYLMAAAGLDANNVDCIKKEVKDGSTFYYVYLKNEATLTVQDTICDMINSNEAEGVVDVENYFNSTTNVIRDSEMVVEIGASGITSIDVATEIRYNPTNGDYTENQVTLKNSIAIEFNKEITDASEYVAPKNTETTIGSFGLNNSKFYL